jgi:hypothetical protein
MKMDLTEGSETSANHKSDAREIPKKTHTIFKTRRKFEIKNSNPITGLDRP